MTEQNKTQPSLRHLYDMTGHLSAVRESYPEFAEDIDEFLFQLGKKYIKGCNDPDCPGCQSASIADYTARVAAVRTVLSLVLLLLAFAPALADGVHVTRRKRVARPAVTRPKAKLTPRPTPAPTKAAPPELPRDLVEVEPPPPSPLDYPDLPFVESARFSPSPVSLNWRVPVTELPELVAGGGGGGWLYGLAAAPLGLLALDFDRRDVSDAAEVVRPAPTTETPTQPVPEPATWLLLVTGLLAGLYKRAA